MKSHRINNANRPLLLDCSQGSGVRSPGKLLILIHSLAGGGAERTTTLLSQHWLNLGWKVTIVTIANSSRSAYGIPKGAKCIALDLARQSESILSGLVANITRIRAIRRLLRAEDPDIAIGMGATSAILLALARTRNVFTIGAEHNYPPMCLTKGSWSALRRWSYGRLDAVTALTSEGKAWLEANTSARRVVVIPNPVVLPLPGKSPFLDPAGFLPSGCKLLLTVGRLTPQKAFDRLIKAFARISEERPDWTLVILGEGDQRAELEALVKAFRLQERIIMPGWAGNVAHWYQAADLFVMTSLYEGFPNALLEAMAHGCSVLSVDCDTGPRDMIRHNINGYLVPQDDPEALVDSLMELTGNPALRARLGAAAKSVCEDFSLEKVNKLWLDLFNSRQDR